MKRSQILLVVLQLLIDIMMASLAFSLAYWINWDYGLRN